MFKQIALIHWSEDATEDQKQHIAESLEAYDKADRSVIGEVMVSANGGHLAWQLHFADQASWEKSDMFDAGLDRLAAAPGVAHIDAVGYSPDPLRLSRPDMKDGIYRALLLHMLDHASPAQEKQFLEETRLMPTYIPEIANAATGKVVRSRGARPWTHVWEQEFQSEDHLRGPYMTSPYHWAVVDRWFDPEMPEHIIDVLLCHSGSRLKDGVMRDYGGPVTA